jgi:hypothetical protein
VDGARRVYIFLGKAYSIQNNAKKSIEFETSKLSGLYYANNRKRSEIPSGPSFSVYSRGTRKLVKEQMGQWILPLASPIHNMKSHRMVTRPILRVTFFHFYLISSSVEFTWQSQAEKGGIQNQLQLQFRSLLLHNKLQ